MDAYTSATLASDKPAKSREEALGTAHAVRLDMGVVGPTPAAGGLAVVRGVLGGRQPSGEVIRGH